MKKIIIGIAVVIIIVLIVWSTLDKSAQEPIFTENETIKIGIILPLSGPAGTLGEASKKSVDLALSKLSVEERAQVEVVYADDQFDPKQTVSVTQKLIDVDKVNAIIAYSSPSSVAASYIAEKASIPMIGLGNSPDINTDKQWVVRYMLGPEQQAQAIEQLLLKGKYKKIALVWNQSDGPKSVHDALVKILPTGGYTIVADESVTKAENDFKTSIAKIRSAKPDVIVAYISPQVGVFAKQAKDVNLNTPLVSGPVFEIVDQIKAAQGGLDNQLFASNDNITFIDDYYKTTGTYPTIAGDYIYDAVMQLVKNTGKTNTQIMESLRKDFSGVAGSYVYNQDGSFDVVQVVKKWDGEKFVIVK
ncbi:MAG: ABC transporter substrate-binding protein [Patescibacteria group bacterium]